MIDAKIGSLKMSERMFAKEHLAVLKPYLQKKDVLLFDRGYPSKELLAQLNDEKIKYVMRVSKNFQAEIDGAKQKDFFLTLSYLKEKEIKKQRKSIMEILEKAKRNKVPIRPNRSFERPKYSHHKKLHKIKYLI